MHGFNHKVSNLLQTLREGEREKVMAQLDPSIKEKLKERRTKERRDPGEGGINPERSQSEAKARHSGVPDYDPANALVESAGKVYKQNNPDDGEFAESDDFARCQRPDGSFYGTSGQCRKGKDAGTKAKDEVGTGKPSKSIKSGGLGEMTIKTEADMKKMSDAELKSHMKLANKVAFQNDVDTLTKAQFDGLADQHKMAKAELKRREGANDVTAKVEANNKKVEKLRKAHAKLPWGDRKKEALMGEIDKLNKESRSLELRATQGPQQKPEIGGAAGMRRAAAAMRARD